MLEGEIEVDESYFGGDYRGSRKGKCGLGAAGKAPVFGLLKRNGKVYAYHTRCKNKDSDAYRSRESEAVRTIGVDIMHLMYLSLSITE